jgi:hypothetical protein
VLIDKDGQCYPIKIKTSEDLKSIKKLFESEQPYQLARP